MIDELTEEEFLDLQALYEIDPTGPRRDDMRAYSAAIVSTGLAEQQPSLFYPYFGESFEDELEHEAIMKDLKEKGYFPE